MNPLTRFSMQVHAGEYETWPLKTRLYADGRATQTLLPGYCLRWQFEVHGQYLLILDYDCPFEERHEVILLNQDLRVVSRASDPARLFTVGALVMGALEVSSANLYCDCEVVDDRTLRLLGCSQPPHLMIRVRERRRFGIGSLLELRSERRASRHG